MSGFTLQFSGWLVIIVLLAGCGEVTPRIAELPPPPVTVSQPIVRSVIAQDDYEGRVAAAEKVEVRARVRGHLIKIYFEAGQRIKKNDLLYEIDPRPYQAALDGADAQLKATEATLQLATAEYQRELVLSQQKASSAREVDVWAAKQAVAKGEVYKAKANREQSKLDLDFTKIYAAISGKMSRTLVDQGNLVNSGGGDTLLTTITSIDPMFVYFNIDEAAIIRYKEIYRKKLKDIANAVPDLKIPVFVALEGEEGYAHQGILDFTDNRVNPGTGTKQVRCILENKSQLFEDGMRARVGSQSAILMKRSYCLNSHLEPIWDESLFSSSMQNIVERREVTLGRIDDGMQIIERGIQPKEWVIVNGIQRVQDGIEVRPKQVPVTDKK